MNRGLAYQAVFTDRSDRETFLDLISDCHTMWGLRVIAYCLMDNHYHLLIGTPQANLSRIMRHLDGVYTQRYNRRHKRDGPLFRGRYKAIVVDAEGYLLGVARYIHHNPVAADLVRFPEEYEWSSCRMYLWEEEKRPRWLEADSLLCRFPEDHQRAAYLAFMRSKCEESVESFYESRRWAPALGSKRFIESLRERLRGRPIKEVVPEARSYLRPDIETCLQVVGQVYGVEEEELLKSRRGQHNEARTLAMYVGRKIAGMKHEDLAKVFGVSGYSAVSSAVGRMKMELKRGGTMAQRFEQIRHLLQS